MKKYLLFYLVLNFIIWTGCKKETADVPATTISGGEQFVANADTSKGYQPVTANTFLKYNIITNGAQTDILTNTMLGTTSIINGKLYNAVSVRSNINGAVINNVSNINHAYSVRDFTSIQGLTTDILYLKDNLPVGSTWTNAFTDSGTLNGDPAQIVGAITDVNLTKVVSGKTFINVIHTTIKLQHNVGYGFTTYGTYDFYVAKGIGIIELDAVVGFPGIAPINTTQLLVDYSIK